MSQNFVACLQLKKRAPSLALTANVTTKRKIAHKVNPPPFNLIGLYGSGHHPMKICLHARLCAFASDKYDVSECIFRTMLEAWNRMVAAGQGVVLF